MFGAWPTGNWLVLVGFELRQQLMDELFLLEKPKLSVSAKAAVAASVIL